MKRFKSWSTALPYDFMTPLTERTSIYDKIGFKGLLHVVHKSTPFHLKWAMPYGLWVYLGMLQRSSTIEDLRYLHEDIYLSSKLFRRLRPRYTAASKILMEEPYHIR
ncbi:hypothetical protein HYX05_04835 [Candidatus Woesearchaeota archaeon]|nr:hypothetical protein [Candidatus Woesearchaeota archaeon]